MKKITAALALVALTATAASANHTGFFLGVGAVTGSTTAKYSDTANSPASAAGNYYGQTNKVDMGKTMFGGRIEAGYGMTFAGSGYAAVSIYGTLLNTKLNFANSAQTVSQNASTAQLKNTSNYGIEVKLGYHLTKDTVGFIGIAAEAGKYKLSWTESNIAATSLRPTLTASKTKVYAKPVIGLRTMFTKNLYLEAKYGYGFSNRVTLNVPNSATNLGAQSSNSGGRTVSFRPRTHEFSVTVGWRF